MWDMQRRRQGRVSVWRGVRARRIVSPVTVGPVLDTPSCRPALPTGALSSDQYAAVPHARVSRPAKRRRDGDDEEDGDADHGMLNQVLSVTWPPNSDTERSGITPDLEDSGHPSSKRVRRDGSPPAQSDSGPVAQHDACASDPAGCSPATPGKGSVDALFESMIHRRQPLGLLELIHPSKLGQSSHPSTPKRIKKAKTERQYSGLKYYRQEVHRKLMLCSSQSMMEVTEQGPMAATVPQRLCDPFRRSSLGDHQSDVIRNPTAAAPSSGTLPGCSAGAPPDMLLIAESAPVPSLSGQMSHSSGLRKLRDSSTPAPTAVRGSRPFLFDSWQWAHGQGPNPGNLDHDPKATGDLDIHGSKAEMQPRGANLAANLLGRTPLQSAASPGSAAFFSSVDFGNDPPFNDDFELMSGQGPWRWSRPVEAAGVRGSAETTWTAPSRDLPSTGECNRDVDHGWRASSLSTIPEEREETGSQHNAYFHGRSQVPLSSLDLLLEGSTHAEATPDFIKTASLRQEDRVGRTETKVEQSRDGYRCGSGDLGPDAVTDLFHYHYQSPQNQRYVRGYSTQHSGLPHPGEYSSDSQLSDRISQAQGDMGQEDPASQPDWITTPAGGLKNDAGLLGYTNREARLSCYEARHGDDSEMGSPETLRARFTDRAAQETARRRYPPPGAFTGGRSIQNTDASHCQDFHSDDNASQEMLSPAVRLSQADSNVSECNRSRRDDEETLYDATDKYLIIDHKEKSPVQMKTSLEE